ncbi:hepatic lectin [Anguilla anguilla]|uniref:hepatic lectin n=1 Tax=Anguilla anguilla TaxID=7936 RepID=UPI0015A9CCC5|nr:hepatic lectin [Anguilla anguilla]
MEMHEMEMTEEESKGKEERKQEDYREVCPAVSAGTTAEKGESQYTALKIPPEDIYSEPFISHASATAIKDLQRRARLYLGLCVILSVLSLILLIAVCILGASRQTVCHDEEVFPVDAATAPKLDRTPCTIQECRQVCSGRRTPARSCRKCDAGWVEFEGSCFYFSRNLRTWNKSREECKNVAGDLAVIDNQRVQEFLVKKGNMAYWIGVIQAKTGQSVWVSTTPGESYWAQSQIEGNCGYLIGGDNPTASWHVSPCSRQTAYICQK